MPIVRKYQFSGKFGLPTSLTPQQQNPFGSINFGQDFLQRMLPLQLKAGLLTQNSSDPLTAIRGKEMVNLSLQGNLVLSPAAPSTPSPAPSPTDVNPVGGTPNAAAGGGFKDFMGKNANLIGAATDIASNMSDAIFGKKKGLDGPNGDLTAAIDEGYNAAADTMMKVNPMVGGIMKVAGFAGDTLNKVGGGTDGMTKADAVLNSAPMTLLTLGLNGFLGNKAETMSKNEDAFAQVGSSYGGTGNVVDDALSKAGKKYGMVSGSAKTEANRLIRKAKMQQGVMSDIADASRDAFAIQSSMSAINGNRRAFNMQGGYDQSAVRVGRHGLNLKTIMAAKRVVSLMKMEAFQKGGKVEDLFDKYVSTLPENQKDSTDFRVRDYWEFNGRPETFDEAVLRGMFTEFKDGWHANSVAENPKTGEIEFMKSDKHPSILKELDWYNSDDAAEFRSKYELQKTSPYYKYVRRKTPYKKEGGVITSDINPVVISIIEPILDIEEYLEKFQEGGKFNVIPEGALHARLHHMDVDNITKKGIPVVAEGEGGQLEQQAEIEREELILRLEVTKRLEELAKDGSEEAAIEAGKLLVHEILNNTVDNTLNLL